MYLGDVNMIRALKVCSASACPNPTSRGQSRCDECKAAADRGRGTAAQRGYNSRAHQLFRKAVLKKDVFCQLCGRIATVADHHPLSRRQLVERALNPNDPKHGRGLCKRCHDRETAANQPGGWNRRGG